jgi:uncharacterized protein YbbK (DUF523 family)
MKESILVSACLLGHAVRYDGGDKRCNNQVLHRWMREKRVVAVCPEVDGGLPIPRPPAEIANAAGGMEVLNGTARVMDNTGRDVTAHFIKGAERVLAVARSRKVRIAILKEGSPSCGSGYIYDGTFTSTKVPHLGVTAALLQQAGVHVFSEDQFVEADRLLRQFEAEREANP